ncbi:MAG: glycine-rich protein, partial [Myxococcota bacterium]|nr:glycine-rich protein [Myxococcota bacterium]
MWRWLPARVSTFVCFVVLAVTTIGCNAILGNGEHDYLAQGPDGTADETATSEGSVDASSAMDATFEGMRVPGADANTDGLVAYTDRSAQDGGDATVETGMDTGTDAPIVVDGPAGPDGPMLLSQGATCTTSAQCATGLSCADGVCCDKPCNGSCQQCNLAMLKGTCSNVPQGQVAPAPHVACVASAASTCKTDGKCDGNGQCQLWSNGTSCGAGSCDNTTNIVVTGFACDGVGACKATKSVPCSPFKCQTSGASCATTCTTSADCVGQPCVGSTCGTVANGSRCTAPSQCTTGICTDGYCCDLACAGSCQACDVAGQEGTCTTIPIGAPHGARSCAGTGSCKGGCSGASAACNYPPGSVTCSAETCTGGVQTLAASCNGAGACGTPVTASCNGGFACNGSACYTTCVGDPECASARPYCSVATGTCQSSAPQGHACTGTGQCATGFCVNGVCCGTSSCSVGDACHAASTCAAGTGICSTPAVKTGSTCDDGNVCTQNDVCQSNGTCVGSAVTCTAKDSCHLPGTCSPGAGCSNPAKPPVHGSMPFSYKGTGSDTWVVPACVTSITVDAAGASGGLGEITDQANTVAPGGLGGYVQATLAVTPGDSLVITIGGRGADDLSSGGPAPRGSLNPSGFNGGGHTTTGGDGGGFSDIRLRGTPLFVAGGGGGGSFVNGAGGAGGWMSGGNGVCGCCNAGTCGANDPAAGVGGSQSVGGRAGSTSTSNIPPADASGSFLTGGNGGECFTGTPVS